MEERDISFLWLIFTLLVLVGLYFFINFGVESASNLGAVSKNDQEAKMLSGSASF